jgi:molybdopterin-containing oxidoreductase family iron-sulfur binding subunit
MQWVEQEAPGDDASMQEKYNRIGANRVLKPISWKSAIKKISSAVKKANGKAVFFGGEETGALDTLIEDFCNGLGMDRVVYDPLQQTAMAEASRLVYGHFGVPSFRFDRAEVVLNFGADFLETWVSPVEHAAGWAKGRRKKRPTRYIHIEPRLSLTGSNADNWHAAKPGSEVHLALAILQILMKQGKGRNVAQDVRKQIWPMLHGASVAKAAKLSGVSEEKVVTIAHRLATAKRSLVIAGGAAASTPEAVGLQTVVSFLNLVLGNVGTTIDIARMRTPRTSLQKATKAIARLDNDEVKVLFMHGANPAYELPSDSNFAIAARKAELKVSLSSHLDESARMADIILPVHHALEDWGDSRPVEGIYSFIQPAMTPVFDTRSSGDLLIQIAKAAGQAGIAADVDSFEDYLKKSWRALHALLGVGQRFALWMRKVQKNGGHFVKPGERVKVSVSPEAFQHNFGKVRFGHNGAKASDPVLFPFPSVKTFDGRAANRPWLQELPDPITQIVWDSWVEIHPDLAKKRGIKQGDLVTVSNANGQLKVPAFVTEYVHPDVVAVPLGQGHSGYGRYADEVASRGNPFQLLSVSTGAALLSEHVQVTRSLGSGNLVIPQGSNSQYGRHLAQTEHVEDRDHGHDDHGHHGGHHEPKQMFEQRRHPLYEWGLVVDLATCTGCSACVVACYAENNIATVGKDICKQGRTMSWLRIERYYDAPDGGDPNSMEELEVSFLPMMCQQCNNAPCEPVCPVYATYHNEEGLNVMAYNRCVGTRYCSNNCSYKVRRYNWFEYEFPEPMNLQLNPDVTKRAGGVMEKCSFCMHRLVASKDRAKDLGRLVEDGDVQPACVQGCPTQALTFGNLKDPKSQVSKQAKDSRAYKVLDHHLNTQPSVTYLSNVRYKNA